MAFSRPPKQAFGPRDLEVMHKAFDSAWAAMNEGHHFGNRDNEEELKEALRQRIVAVAEEGVSDPEMLRDIALETLPKI